MATNNDSALIEQIFTAYLPDKYKSVRPLYAIPQDVLGPVCAQIEADFQSGKISSMLSSTDMQRITSLTWLSSGMGGYHNQLQTFMTGMDRFGKVNVTPASEQVGLTFITRPRLCLQSSNLRTNRIMTTLDTLNPSTMAFGIRALLDTNFGKVNGGKYAKLVAMCPMCDVHNPFMVPLCNAIVSFSGSPDIDLEAATTDGGYMSEAQSFAVGGSNLQRGTYSISITFNEVIHFPILAIFQYWIEYIRCVTRGLMMAYADDVDNQRLNYTVSIYRFLLDPSRRYITKYAKYTGCFPTGLPIGSDFNYEADNVASTASNKLSITFQCNKVEYMDYAILMDFNALVKRYFPNIDAGVKTVIEQKTKTTSETKMVRQVKNGVVTHDETKDGTVQITGRRTLTIVENGVRNVTQEEFATITKVETYNAVREEDVQVVPTDAHGNITDPNILYKYPRLPNSALVNYHGLPYITSDPNGFRLDWHRVPNPASHGNNETIADQLLYLDLMHRLKFELANYDQDFKRVYPEYYTLAEKYGRVNLGNFVRNAFAQAETANSLDPIVNEKSANKNKDSGKATKPDKMPTVKNDDKSSPKSETDWSVFVKKANEFSNNFQKRLRQAEK